MRQNRVTKSKNSNLRQLVQQMDATKKVNPHDLSADQDLSIGLMNLIAIEEMFRGNNPQKQKNGVSELLESVGNIRRDLMPRLVKSNADKTVARLSVTLLTKSVQLMEQGTRTLGDGNSTQAYKMFDQTYDFYSLFWGINMGLIDVDDVRGLAPTVFESGTYE